jgi:hypothetical protein
MADYSMQHMNMAPRQTAGDIDMLAQANGLNANLGNIASILLNRFALSAFSGSFTMGAAATQVIADVNTKANSIIWLVANNASAASMMATAKNPYVSVKAANTSFTVATADGTAATGGQIFSYIILNVG